jgi:hypothetical protein
MTRQPSAYDEAYQKAGEQCSSTNEGRYVNFVESELTHPANASGLVEKGMPCVTFELCGVAMTSASSASEIISLDTEGIWWLDVHAYGVWLTNDIVVGQRLYIDLFGGTAEVSDDVIGIPFGWALQGVTFEETELIAVKVHSSEWLLWVFWYFYGNGNGGPK